MNTVEVTNSEETTVVEVIVEAGAEQFIEVQVNNPEPEEMVEVDVPASPGLSAYEIALQTGFTGTAEEWLESQRGPAGPQGGTGPQGPPGLGSTFSYIYTFASPTTSWHIDHNLNTYAIQIELFDQNGDAWEAAIRYLNENSVVVEWYFPMSGFARLFS